MNKVLKLTVLITFTFLGFACQEKKKSPLEIEIEKALPELESLSGNFDPSLTVQPSSSHRPLKIELSPDGTYKIVSIGELRKGTIPYQIDKKPNKRNMEFSVEFMDNGGKFLGSYSIEHPLNLRTCEGGDTKVQRSKDTNFELLIPSDENIQMVGIRENGKSMSRMSLKFISIKE